MWVPIMSFAFALAASAAPPLPPPGAWPPADLEYRQQQEQLRQALIRQQNELMALEAQIRARQGIEDLQAQAQSPRITQPSAGERSTAATDLGAMAQIPDSILAESNRRVLEASRRR